MTTHYTSCPLCGDSRLFPLITCRDHSVSGEDFPIVQCEGCSFKFTQDIPDEASIGPYYKSEDYVSHSRSKKGVINWLYHLVKEYTISGKYNLVNRLTQGNSIIDYGCGTGDFLSFCQKKGWNTKGFEPSPEARERTRQLGLQVAPPEELSALADHSADVITLWHVLEHVHQLEGTLKQLHRILKPGGKLVIAVPNCSSLDARHYKAFWAAYDVPRHLYHFEPKTIKKLVLPIGFKAREIQPMVFDAYYVSLLSEKYKRNGKMGPGTLLAGFYQGLRSNLNADDKNLAHSSLIYIFEKQHTTA